MSEPASLAVHGVSHTYPGATGPALREVTFHVPPGEGALLLGPNGSGKTTLLMRIVGLLHGPGRIEVDGQEVVRANLAVVRRWVGFLWQNADDALLLPTVREDVAFGPLNDGLTTPDALAQADRWLERLHLSHLSSRPIQRLSLGEKQRVSLAGVLAREPGMILLDEPTSFLDQPSREALLAILQGVTATLLIATHEPGFFAGLGRALGEVRVGEAKQDS